MTFFPFMVPMPVSPTGLADRVQQLEAAVVLLLESLQSVTENLERKFGPGCAGEVAGRLAGTAPDAEIEAVLENLDRELKAGNSPAVVRKLRDELGCTWDQAHDAVDQWQTLSRDRKFRSIRLAKLRKCLEPRTRE